MYALFSTKSEYDAMNDACNELLGYPDGVCVSYAPTAKQTIDGKYAMLVLPKVAHLFVGCEIVETVEYPEEIS